MAKDLMIDRQVINRVETQGTSIYMIRRYCIYAGITLKKFFDSELFNQ